MIDYQKIQEEYEKFDKPKGFILDEKALESDFRDILDKHYKQVLEFSYLSTKNTTVIQGYLIEIMDFDATLLGIKNFSGEETNIYDLVSDALGCKSAKTFSYHITDKIVPLGELEENMTRLSLGEDIDIGYYHHYSDLTGYLWTDENFVIGGHDLRQELASSIGKIVTIVIEK